MSRRVLLVGDHGHREFRDAIAWLSERCLLMPANDTPSALARIDRSIAPPEAIVIAQSHPGQYGRQEIEWLHRAAPLARLIALLGSWCEGETRTGHPWPGVVRVYWHQFTSWTGGALLDDDSGSSPAWALPRTSTGVERLLLSSRAATLRGSGLIAIGAANATSCETLADPCTRAGYCTVWLSPCQTWRTTGPVAGIWDSSGCLFDELSELKAFVGAVAPAPVLALLSFPRLQDFRAARSAGVSAIISKPFLLQNLLAQLGRMTESATVSAGSATAA